VEITALTSRETIRYASHVLGSLPVQVSAANLDGILPHPNRMRTAKTSPKALCKAGSTSRETRGRGCEERFALKTRERGQFLSITLVSCQVRI